VHISTLKGIVHFEINLLYVLAYLKGIQDVGVFVSTVFSILIFFVQTVVIYQLEVGTWTWFSWTLGNWFRSFGHGCGFTR